MSKSRKKFTEEFKREAVRLVLRDGVSVPQAAQDLEIGVSTLENWISLHRKSQAEDSPLSADEREELKRLRKENNRLKMEQEILKKAAIYFAKTSA